MFANFVKKLLPFVQNSALPIFYNFNQFLMLSKRYESTEEDRRTWLHVPSGTHWSTSSDTHRVVEIKRDV